MGVKIKDICCVADLQGLDSDDYMSLIKDFHKISDRHVAIYETVVSNSDMKVILDYVNRLRLLGNDLVYEMRKHLDQMKRTKVYKNLIRLYNKACEDKDSRKKKDYGKQLEALYKKYDITWDYCRKLAQSIRLKYNIDSIFALTRAEDVWSGVEKCLYSTGKNIHYLVRDRYPVMRAKQINRGLVIKQNKTSFTVNFGKIVFRPVLKDRFLCDENDAMVEYLNDSLNKDVEAVYNAVDGRIISTYRPCYASLVVKIIRNKPRLYLHITLEGKAKPKYDKYGNPRHKWGTGRVGCDIGTQTIAVTTDTNVILKNLAERGSSVYENEREEKRLYRAMERSRRVNNPNNYNVDGTIKHGCLKWIYSNRYKRLKSKHRELCRKNSLNRHYAINEDVNMLRCLGNIFITEPKNAKQLQKKARLKKKKDGSYKRRKRFGKSIKNRCPGYFQSQCKKVFSISGSKYIEVNKMYRASQYDHIKDEYIKKSLSDRFFRIGNGDSVQRDMYSSFLLYNSDGDGVNIDRASCIGNYEKFKRMHDFVVNYIKTNKIEVKNSGIVI